MGCSGEFKGDVTVCVSAEIAQVDFLNLLAEPFRQVRPTNGECLILEHSSGAVMKFTEVSREDRESVWFTMISSICDKKVG